MLSITSLQNQKIKDLIKLRESRQRRQTGLFLLEGARELERALLGGFTLSSLYICLDFLNPSAERLVESIDSRKKTSISPEVFAKLAVREGSDGLVAVFEARHYTWADLSKSPEPLFLVLEDIEKPGNFGALARTADGAGVDAIIVLDPKADIYNPNAIRSSVGGLFSRPILLMDHANFATHCLEHKIRILTASPFAKQHHFDADLRGALAIVLGSEAWGLSPAWQNLEHVPVKIPMLGLGDSLNVSVAGAVVIYEALRQRLRA